MYPSTQQTEQNKMKKQKSVQAQAAAMIRKHLKKNGIKATVKSASASMTNSVDIYTNDLLPATEKLVSDYVSQFKKGYFDGKTDDSYEYSNSRSDIPQVKFVTYVNEYRDEIKQAAWEWTRETFGDFENSPQSFLDIIEHDEKMALTQTLHDSKADFWNEFKAKKTVKTKAA